MSPSKTASAVVAVITIFLVVIFATSESGVERLRTHLVGEVAPPIAGETSDGGYWSLDEVRGRWLLVNFFSTTCIPCIEEHPELLSFSENQPTDTGVRVVSVAFDDDPLSVEAFFEKNGGDWPVLTRDTGRISVDWGVIAVPESFLV